MTLVDYSDSESSSSTDEEAKNAAVQTSSRKRKNSDNDDPRPGSVRITRTASFSVNGTNINTTSPLSEPSSSPLPSLPPTFHSLYATPIRTSTLDDPTLHSGRTRQIPHIEGNWPTHIYLEWFPSPAETSRLTDLLTTATKPTNAPSNPVHTLLHSRLSAPLPLHISLSATLTVPTALKSNFLDALVQAITSSTIRPFTVTTRASSTAGLDWVPNSDRTRWFLVLRVNRPEGDELNRLLAACNRVVDRFGMRMLYEQAHAAEGAAAGRRRRGGFAAPGRKNNHKRGLAKMMLATRAADAEVSDRSSCFHISIAWTLQDPTAGGRGGGGGGGGGGADADADGSLDLTRLDGKDMEISFDVVKLKMGNVVHDIPLPKAPTMTRI